MALRFSSLLFVLRPALGSQRSLRIASPCWRAFCSSNKNQSISPSTQQFSIPEDLLRSAKEGDPKSQFELSREYNKMHNWKESYNWLYRSANRGDARAQLQLGKDILASNSPHKQEALRWVTKAAVSGMVEAQYFLAKTYCMGEVPENPKLGLFFAKKAAEQNYPAAQQLLGLMYCNGIGTEINHGLAFKNFQMAADSGLPEAYISVAGCLLQGLGVEKNPALADEYFFQASKVFDYHTVSRYVNHLTETNAVRNFARLSAPRENQFDV